MRDEPLTGGNPESETGMVHKMTLFKFKMVTIVNNCYLMFEMCEKVANG